MGKKTLLSRIPCAVLLKNTESPINPFWIHVIMLSNGDPYAL